MNRHDVHLSDTVDTVVPEVDAAATRADGVRLVPPRHLTPGRGAPAR